MDGAAQRRLLPFELEGGDTGGLDALADALRASFDARRDDPRRSQAAVRLAFGLGNLAAGREVKIALLRNMCVLAESFGRDGGVPLRMLDLHSNLLERGAVEPVERRHNLGGILVQRFRPRAHGVDGDTLCALKAQEFREPPGFDLLARQINRLDSRVDFRRALHHASGQAAANIGVAVQQGGEHGKGFVGRNFRRWHMR